MAAIKSGASARCYNTSCDGMDESAVPACKRAKHCDADTPHSVSTTNYPVPINEVCAQMSTVQLHADIIDEAKHGATTDTSSSLALHVPSQCTSIITSNAIVHEHGTSKTDNSFKPHIIAVYTPKDSVGKTTFVHSLAVSLAKTRQRVLLVDADPQCDLSNYFVDAEDAADFALNDLCARYPASNGTSTDNRADCATSSYMYEKANMASTFNLSDIDASRCDVPANELAELVLAQAPVPVQSNSESLNSNVSHAHGPISVHTSTESLESFDENEDSADEDYQVRAAISHAYDLSYLNAHLMTSTCAVEVPIADLHTACSNPSAAADVPVSVYDPEEYPIYWDSNVFGHEPTLQNLTTLNVMTHLTDATADAMQNAFNRIAAPAKSISSTSSTSSTLFDLLAPLIQGQVDCNYDISTAVHSVSADTLWLVRGSPRIIEFDSVLHTIESRPLRRVHVLGAFRRLLLQLACELEATTIIIDFGPSTGMMNRTFVSSCDFLWSPCFADAPSTIAIHSLYASVLPQWTRWFYAQRAAHAHDLRVATFTHRDLVRAFAWTHTFPQSLPLIVTNYHTINRTIAPKYAQWIDLLDRIMRVHTHSCAESIASTSLLQFKYLGALPARVLPLYKSIEPYTSKAHAQKVALVDMDIECTGPQRKLSLLYALAATRLILRYRYTALALFVSQL